MALDLKTQMLCHDGSVFINGAAHPVEKEAYRVLRALADARQLEPATELPPQAVELLYQWYCDGYIAPIKRAR